MYWYQNNHLGTLRELTALSGNIEWEAVYQAWGMSEDKKNNVFPEAQDESFARVVKLKIIPRETFGTRKLLPTISVSKGSIMMMRQGYTTTAIGTIRLMSGGLFLKIR